MEDKSLKLMKLETPLEKMHKLFHSANYLGATNIETRKVLEYLKYAAELEKSLIKKAFMEGFQCQKKENLTCHTGMTIDENYFNENYTQAHINLHN
jgi:hypothetical protein